MAVSKKKTTKKTAAAKTAATSLPQSADVPEHMKQLGGGYAPSWKPEEVGDSIHGIVSAPVREVEFKQGRKVVQRRVCEVTTMDGVRFAVWESAALGTLFDQLAEDEAAISNEEGPEVFIAFDGLGKKKAGQNAPKLFTVAIAE